jgi:4-nitrophenyl phosphatase
MHTIGMILDLDGTIYAGGRLLPGAGEFIEQLKRSNIPYLYVTNNSSRTPAAVAKHLRGLGIPADDSEIYTSALAAASCIRDSNLGGKAYVIGEDGLRQALAQAGIELADEQPDVVVQGIDRQFSYEKLRKAVQFIRAGAPYVLTNPDLLLPAESGFWPGAGALSAAIRAAAQTEPLVVGKPSPVIIDIAAKRLRLPHERIWVIGDNLLTDMKAGISAGTRTALVLTGVTNEQNLERSMRESGVQPDLVCPSLLAALQQILP